MTDLKINGEYIVEYEYSGGLSKAIMHNDKLISGKTIKDLPKDYTWDDIFEIAIGIPTGTRMGLKRYFEIPKLK